ncbi:PX domain-containing protein [Rhodotorula toruloides]|nr:PX domain-containing protein [Rhodotorula toruloides]
MSSADSPSSSRQTSLTPTSASRSSSLLIPVDDSKPTRRIPLRTSSLASDLGILPPPSVAASLAPPSDNPLLLTPLRAHYLKRELVTLEFVKELSQLDSPGALSVLGPPFLPKSRFVNGVPQPAPAPGSDAARSEERDWESNVDLPFLRFVFHHFVLSFPFLIACPPTFFSHKLQPFVYSFVSRNISSSDERESVTKRKRIAGKVEKHLGLVMSAAIKLTENDGKEEVVRIEDDGSMHAGAPATQQSGAALVGMKRRGPLTKLERADEEFSINVVSVRNRQTKSRMRIKRHEEFLVRTRRKGMSDVYVARRYGDFVRLAETLKKECIEEDVRGPPAKDRRSTEMKPAASPDASTQPSPRPSFTGDESPSQPPTPVFDPNHVPSLARERNRLTLRAYLRSLLSNPVIAASDAFQSFLLESPIQLTPAEEQDVLIREEMDRIREQEMKSFRAEVEERVEELEGYLRKFREELVKHDGLSRVFATIRQTERVDDLPVEYRKVMEWARISLASTIYQLFLGSDNSSSVFASLKRVHGLMPYFMLRGILKISNPVAMIRSVLDLFLARPFGSTSLVQKMFSSGLNEEAKDLRDDAELVARKIGDDRLCEKVRQFVDAPRDDQDAMRLDAESEGIDLMTVILRQSGAPRLDPRTMQYLARCAVRYEEYKKVRDALHDPDEDEGPTNDEAWLYEDLYVYKRLITAARDKEQLIELIFEVGSGNEFFYVLGSTSELLKDIVTIFYEPLARVYKAANIADSLSDLQAFINDLIKTVEYAEDANLTEPQRTVQLFVDLVARHEDRFYHFVHQVHSKGEGLFDNLMAWIELFINFVRDGLPSRVSLDFLLPVGGKEREEVLAEVDALVEYHRKLKLAHHERMKKRMVKGGGDDLDKNADAAFVSGVMQNLHIGDVMDDVHDVEAEDSDEEAAGYSSSESELEADEQPPPPLPNKDPPQVPPRPPRKKDRAPIDPPKLEHIPRLVPVFVELVRNELNEARRQKGKPRQTAGQQ